ncbi:MAG: FAD-dependent 5-carboxymethylaminomethyl-2-thiouridine(34) oxidoreductase MnmC [Oceanospirillaceae bacterium]|nr:FAD-dependent 5-carboxymethylaminomethyl-2-thiouridine(34) oxidoreductase MnmC [Oceanospirillaceae bacterium]
MKTSPTHKAFSDPQSLVATPKVAAALMARLQKNPLQLNQRHQELAAILRDHQVLKPQSTAFSMRVLDTDFGVGLDFLQTWKLWIESFETGHHPHHLDYVAVCEQPLRLADAKVLHQSLPQLNALSAKLQEQYPEPIKGFHQLDFGKVKLTLVYAELTQALAQIRGDFDVHLGPTEAVFCAGATSHKTYVPPWHRPHSSLAYKSKVAIIGAGICGTATALGLSERGFEVTLIEKGEALASGASGNRQGMLYAKLPDNATIAGQFHQQGLQHTMAALKRHLGNEHWQACGLMQVATDEKQATQMQAVLKREYPSSWLQWLNQRQAQQLAKQPVSAGGLYFPKSGWVSPKPWCEALYKKSGADLWLNTTVLSMQQTKQQGWRLSLSGAYEGEYEFDAVVIANANGAKNLLAQQNLALKAIRGQVTYVETQQSPALVVCGQGYVTPGQQGILSVGASYNLHTFEPQLSDEDHVGNLERLRQVLPNKKALDVNDVMGGWVGFRAVTPDYLPMVGQLADEAAVIKAFAKLRQDANYKFVQDMPYLPGLYINAGHGSKGFVSAPLSAQILASQMANQSLPVAQCVAWGLDPNRFIIRDLIRRKR